MTTGSLYVLDINSIQCKFIFIFYFLSHLLLTTLTYVIGTTFIIQMTQIVLI
jgi:hypothetical protein